MKKSLLKRMAMLLTMVILVCNLVACGGDKYADSPYVGTWKGTTAEYSGLEMNVADIMGGEFDFILEANGKCTVSIAGDTEKGSWEPTDNGFSVEDEFVFIVDGSSAVLDYDGVTMNFEKE